MNTVARARWRHGPNPITRVDPAWLEPRLSSPDLRILDVRGAPPSADASGPRLRRSATVPIVPFAQSHVPGAIAFDVRASLFDDAGEVVSAPELAMVMSSLGVGDDHTIVLVDEAHPDTALAAARALTRYGHRDVNVLEGGFTRWLAERRRVSRDVVRHPPASFTAKVFG